MQIPPNGRPLTTTGSDAQQVQSYGTTPPPGVGGSPSVEYPPITDPSSMFYVNPGAIKIIDDSKSALARIGEERVKLTALAQSDPDNAEYYVELLDELDTAEESAQLGVDLQQDIIDADTKALKSESSLVESRTKGVVDAAKKTGELAGEIGSLSDAIKPRGGKGGGGGGGGLPGG